MDRETWRNSGTDLGEKQKGPQGRSLVCVRVRGGSVTG